MTIANPITLRPAVPSDTDELARLAEQLGYPSFDVGNLHHLLRGDGSDETLIVATDTASSATLVGWIHLRRWRTLLVGDVVDIGGVVVDERHRGQGLGALLISAAAAWGRERGARLLQARSGSQRSDAHGFYHHLGFNLTKQQHVFHLTLTTRP